jgi:isochorismate hydrolase
MLIAAEKSSLLLIDIQERLLPAMAGAQNLERRCIILLKAAKRLEVPIAVSEQYPQGLGATVAPLREHIGNAPVFAKTEFSGWRNEALKTHLIGLHEAGRPQVVVAGIEAHVCVLQTAIDLAQAGFAVFAVADAIASRAPASVALAEERMRQAGVAIVNTEMAVFELLTKAGTPEFRDLSMLVR